MRGSRRERNRRGSAMRLGVIHIGQTIRVVEGGRHSASVSSPVRFKVAQQETCLAAAAE